MTTIVHSPGPAVTQQRDPTGLIGGIRDYLRTVVLALRERDLDVGALTLYDERYLWATIVLEPAPTGSRSAPGQLAWSLNHGWSLGYGPVGRHRQRRYLHQSAVPDPDTVALFVAALWHGSSDVGRHDAPHFALLSSSGSPSALADLRQQLNRYTHQPAAPAQQPGR